jgi:ABC-type siderophore export system fused ATPase/permease subunit
MHLLRMLWRESMWLFLCSILASLGTAAVMLYLLATISQFLGNAQLPLTWWELLTVILVSAALQIGASVAISASAICVSRS